MSRTAAHATQGQELLVLPRHMLTFQTACEVQPRPPPTDSPPITHAPLFPQRTKFARRLSISIESHPPVSPSLCDGPTRVQVPHTRRIPLHSQCRHWRLQDINNYRIVSSSKTSKCQMNQAFARRQQRPTRIPHTRRIPLYLQP